MDSPQKLKKTRKGSVDSSDSESLSENDSNDSLGILSEEQLESVGQDDTDEVFPNFQALNLQNEQSLKDGTPTFCMNKWILNEEPEISPICARDKSSPVDLSTLESTPKIKQSLHEIIDKKSSTRNEENILNKTIKISSMCDDVPKENFSPVESVKELNAEHNILNLSSNIDENKQDDGNASLNRTFGTRNILNKTLPSVISSVDTHSNLSSEEMERMDVHNKTFSESQKETLNKTIGAYERKKHKLPVEAKHPQERISHPVTKIKHEKTDEKIKNSRQNNPRSSCTTSDCAVESKDFSKFGAKPKISKTDRKSINLKKKSSHTFNASSPESRVITKTNIKKSQIEGSRPKNILSNLNRDIKILGSSSSDKNRKEKSSIKEAEKVKKKQKNLEISAMPHKEERKGQLDDETERLAARALVMMRPYRSPSRLRGRIPVPRRETVRPTPQRPCTEPVRATPRRDCRIPVPRRERVGTRTPRPRRESVRISPPRDLADETQRYARVIAIMEHEIIGPNRLLDIAAGRIPVPRREPIPTTPSRIPCECTLPVPRRVHTTPLRIPGDSDGSEATFRINNPFDPPVRGRFSARSIIRKPPDPK